MNQYSSRQAGIVRRLARAILRLLSPFRAQALTEQQYNVLLGQMYDLVDDARRESAKAAREFFDTQWNAELPDADTPDVDLAAYRPEWFEAAMRPLKPQLTSRNTPRETIARASQVATKEAENGGRRTIIRAVETNKRLVGWARYDPEPPTCAFCLMLISRGPVYTSESAANYKTRKAKTYRGNDRETFHPGCTCKVVPVFSRDRWEGRDQYRDAEKLWQDATRGWSGKNALNAFRRAVETQRRHDIPDAA
ncbi:hypothetical protein [Saccharopolyspora taberi]|uniref:Uncharacterized protein n=1 Tax=Saccharopolyspora taberi TaxID=60895 RepID=A0ABN3VKL7_9PSEU